MPEDKPTNISPLTEKPDGLHYVNHSLKFRITGLSPNDLGKMKVTLKTSLPESPDPFYIDTIDMYNGKNREGYAESCEKYLKVKQSVCMSDLNTLMSLLENERTNMQNKKGKKTILEMAPFEKKEALDILKSPDLTQKIIEGFNSIGLVGEDNNKLLGYLASVSRLLPDPLGLLILSRSGAGKTSLQDAICKLVPPESVIQYTRMTGQSLFYREEDALKNKVLAIEEEEGMQEAMYSVRTLQSSQKLSIATTRSDAKTGKMNVDEYTVYGPVVVMISTTNPNALDPETRQRFLILTIDESRKQTQHILRTQRMKNGMRWYKMTMDERCILRQHHNIQRLLKPLTPVFPDELEITYPDTNLQMRREQGKYLSLIKAITLLHQYQRKTGTLKRVDGSKVNYVMVDKKDVALALKLGNQIFNRNVDDVSPTGRTLLSAITTLVSEKLKALKANDPKGEFLISQIPFTRKELREAIGWSEAQVRQNIDPLIELGYLGVLKGKWGATFRYVLLDDGKNDPNPFKNKNDQL